MEIQKNRIVWPKATEGRYLVRVQAEQNGQSEEADWQLNVLKTEFPDPVVHSTRHIDYIVPRAYADWMHESGADNIVDAYYEYARDLVGGLPSDARQSIIYTPSIGGAHSGDPIVSGPGTFGDNDVNRWKLGFLFHELGHDLNAWTRVGNIEHGDATVDNCLHDMVEFNKIAWVIRLLKNPNAYGIRNVTAFTDQMKAESMEWVPEFDKYVEYANKGGEFLRYKETLSNPWAGMVHRYGFTYGAQALENCIRLIRRDGLPLSAYLSGQVSATDRFTELFCIMSSAAGRELQSTFRAMGMPINNALYAELTPKVVNAMANIPPLARNGAVHCPIDDHYYCVTPYGTTWTTAETIARRLGGHLATIRSVAQEEWLANKFGPDGWMWVGLRRNNDNGQWRWVTQEPNQAKLTWDPDRPLSEPERTAAVLGLHEEANKSTFGLANTNPNDGQFGIIEFNLPPNPRCRRPKLIAYPSSSASRISQSFSKSRQRALLWDARRIISA